MAADKFAEIVAEKSDGNIKIVVFSNGSLYSDIEEIRAVQEGNVDIIAPSTSKLGMLNPAWGYSICRLFSLPMKPLTKG